MTTLYYLPRENISGNLASFPPEEARHAIQVVRHKIGDEILAVDGEGGWYRVRLRNVNKRVAEGEIVETRRGVGEPTFNLTVALALLKNQKRYDLFVEKAAELGVSRIIPLITSRTEKKTIKTQRVEKILIAAMKQCGRSKLVDFDEVQPLSALLQKGADVDAYCCHEAAGESVSLRTQLASQPGSMNILMMIGPEGGFSDEEVSMMESQGFSVVSLGPRRLRAETAAIVASAGVMLHWAT